MGSVRRSRAAGGRLMARRDTSLTSEEQAALATYHQRYLGYGLSTEPADRTRAEAAFAEVYRGIGREPVPVIWADSPLTANLILQGLRQLRNNPESNIESSLRDSLRDSLGGSLRISLGGSLRDSLRISLWTSLWTSLGASLRTSLWTSLADSLRTSLEASLVTLSMESTYWWGQMDAPWIAFYRFAEAVLHVPYEEAARKKLQVMDDLVQSCGWWYPRDGVIVACERPLSVTMEEHPTRPTTYRLHASDGPAVQFRDGWSIYAWHGVRVPAKLIETPSQITRTDILDTTNAEVRRAMMERLGHDRFASLLDLEVRHEERYGPPGHVQIATLLRTKEWDAVAEEYLQFVRVTCPSTGRIYHLAVPPDIRTAKAAVAWTFDREAETYSPAVEQ